MRRGGGRRARTLQPACVVPAAPDMVVNTETERVQHGPPRDPGAAGLHRRSKRGAEIQDYIERYGAAVDGLPVATAASSR